MKMSRDLLSGYVYLNHTTWNTYLSSCLLKPTGETIFNYSLNIHIQFLFDILRIFLFFFQFKLLSIFLSECTNQRVSMETTDTPAPLRPTSPIPNTLFPRHTISVGQYPQVYYTSVTPVTKFVLHHRQSNTSRVRAWYLDDACLRVCLTLISCWHKHVTATMQPIQELPYFCHLHTHRASLFFDVIRLDRT